MNSVTSLLIGSSVLIFPVPAAMSSALRHNDKGQLIWVWNFNWFIELGFFIINAKVTGSKRCWPISSLEMQCWPPRRGMQISSNAMILTPSLTASGKNLALPQTWLISASQQPVFVRAIDLTKNNLGSCQPLKKHGWRRCFCFFQVRSVC